MKKEQNTTNEFYGAADLNVIMAQAMHERSEYLADVFAAGWSRVKGFVSNYVTGPLAQAIDSAQAYDQLSRLSDRDLKDLGIDRSQIAHYAFRAGEADLTTSVPANANLAASSKAKTAA